MTSPSSSTARHRYCCRPWIFTNTSSRGTVKLAGMPISCPAMADIRRDLAGTRHFIPETEGAGSQETVVSCTEQMAADPKQILDNAVHRCELL